VPNSSCRAATEGGTDVSIHAATEGPAVTTRSQHRRSRGQGQDPGVWLPVGVIVIIVVAVHAPELFGWLDPNPIHIVGGADNRTVSGVLPGLPFIDPNIGITSQALGHRSILDWLSGAVPWWNPYEGVGSPLAAGFQAASFFPATILTLFANGQVFLHMILEITAGIATFFLLRELALRRWIATLGGVLFALNGTFAWMGHAPANPVAFLPLLLLGIERAFRASGGRRRGGTFLIPVAIALSIVAGFPETAFIDGLLAALWVAVRLIQGSPDRRKAFAAKIVKGGLTGLLLAAPLLVAVYEYLPSANIGIHSHIVDDALSRAATPLLLMPYALGPIDAFNQYDPSGTIANLWGGGFLTTSLVFLAIVSLAGASHRGLRIALAAWATFGLSRVLGFGIAFQLTKVVPYLDHTLFSAYSAPSWEMATLLLAIFGLDDLMSSRVPKFWILVAGVGALVLTGLASLVIRSFLKDVDKAPGGLLAAHLSVAWAFFVIVVLIVCSLAAFRAPRLVAPLFCALLFFDVAGMFVVPELSNPRSGQLDVGLISFLKDHLGTSRFYTFGPISPNYGSYFGIASINVNDVPVPTLWTNYISTHLDTNTYPIEFTGYVRLQPTGPSAAEEFRDHINNYAWVGVKYVVTTPDPDLAALGPPGRLRLVYDDGTYDVLQLSGTAPFFQAPRGDCTITWTSWNDATSRCGRASPLVRRELYMKGWSVSVNGQPAPIAKYDGLFQSVTIPAGKATISFHYAPPHEVLGIGAFGLGVLVLVGEAYVGRRDPRLAIRRRRADTSI
jgi:hypothetical protein